MSARAGILAEAASGCDTPPPMLDVRLPEIRKSSFVFEYRVVTGEKTGSDAESRQIASGKTIQALYDWDAKKTLPFTDELRKKIEAREGSRLKIVTTR